MDKDKRKKIEDMAKYMRRKMIEMAYNGNGYAHFGSGLSIVEILAVLYGEVMNIGKEKIFDEERDRFILSKGHGVLGYYAALAAAGIINENLLLTFQQNDSDLISHPVMNLALGIESSNGSLGHGLSIAIGSLIAGRIKKKKYNAYVLLGNGECNEGSIWEAAMFAASHKLNNLIAIIDNNQFQSDGYSREILDMGSLKEKWNSFGWNAIEVDGHSIPDLYCVLTTSYNDDKPLAVIANTIKGKGISFMENNNDWHHNRLTAALYENALSELKE
jgi:Transketolase, N-terminal subunit